VVADSNLRFITILEDRDENTIGQAYCNDKDTLYLMDTGHIRKFLFGQERVHKLEEFNLPEKGNYWCMLKSTADSIWIAKDGGLFVMNVRTKKYRTISELKGFDVRALYADAKGTVWIGTYGKGWYKYEQGRGLIEMPVDRLRNLTNVHAFIEDKLGYIWMSTNNGLFRFLKNDLDKVNKNTDYIYYNYFTKEYGFRTNEFNGGCSPSVVRMNDGRFVFPSINGLVLFHPEDIPVEIPDSILLTDDIMVDGKFLNSTEDIVLKPSFSNLSLKLSIPYYGHHYNLQVQYRLSGGGDRWTRLNDDGTISFNRLVHGDYTLSIRILSGYGSRGFMYKEINFIVERFWYQAWWFSALVILLVTGIVTILVRRRIRNIQRQKVLLEAEVIKRTEDLKQSEEKVKQNARFKSQVTSLVLHDVRSPLFYLNKITGSIYHTSEGQVPENFREQLKDLHLSVKDISAYAQTLFAWINAQQDDFKLNAMPVRLFDMFEEICGNYYLLAAQNNNTIGHNTDEQLTVVTQADLLQIILRNMVDNAIKFTKNGKIMLSAEAKGDNVYVTVSDTGKGMAPDRIELIVSKEGDNNVDSRSGMGYRFIKDLLKKMEGRLDVMSKQGEGTTVTVILPAKKK
jgi:signal transduction histidine kinase